MRIINAKKTGRLGNRLILSTHLLAVAIEYQASLKNIPFIDYNVYFANDLFDFLKKTDAGFPYFLYHLNRLEYKIAKLLSWSSFLRWRTYRDSSAPSLLIDELLKGKKIKRLYLQGYKFRASHLVSQHASLIRESLTPIKSVLEKSKVFKKKDEKIIGVHIRQGDYKEYLGGIFFYEIECYLNWISSLSKNQEMKFIIFSDGIFDREIFEELDVEISKGTEIEDLFKLAQCDYIMGPPSSFSAWAAWWGNKPLLHLYTDTGEISLDQFQIQDYPDNPDCL